MFVTLRHSKSEERNDYIMNSPLESLKVTAQSLQMFVADQQQIGILNPVGQQPTGAECNITVALLFIERSNFFNSLNLLNLFNPIILCVLSVFVVKKLPLQTTHQSLFHIIKKLTLILAAKK